MDTIPKIRGKPHRPGGSGLLSLLLPLCGFAIVYCVGHREHQGDERLRALMIGFALWTLASLLGAISALFSLRCHGFTVVSSFGLALCSAPFLYLLFILGINAK